MFRRKIITLLILLIVIQLFGLVYFQRYAIQGWAHKTFSKESLNTAWEEVKSQFKSSELPAIEDLERVPLPKYNIEIAPSDWRRLNEGITQSSKRIQVPVTLETDGQAYPGKARISSGAGRHWEGERKSLRVRFADDRLFKGMREINLNIPETHRVIIDPLAWDFAARMGLPIPENGFVRLEIDGQPQGLRIWYEDVDQFWLERNGLMGYIFTEDDAWFPFHYRSSNDADYPEVKVINKKGSTLNEIRYLAKVLSYPSTEQMQKELTRLMDMPQVLTWHAHALLCGSGHQNVHNIQLYFNSSLQKFQAIPWDIAGFDHWGHEGRETWAMDLDWCTNRMIFRINQIPEFVHLRNQILYQTITQVLPESVQQTLTDQRAKEVRYYLYSDDLKQASQNRFSNEDFEAAIQNMKGWITKRNQFIKESLEQADLRVTAAPSGDHDLLLALGTGKESGVRVSEISVPVLRGDVDVNTIRLYLDTNGDGALDKNDQPIQAQITKNGKKLRINIDALLLPARNIVYDSFFDYVDKGYMLQTHPIHQYYQYILSSSSNGKQPLFESEVAVVCENAITGSPVQPEYFTSDMEREYAIVYQERGTSEPVVALKTPQKAEVRDLMAVYNQVKQDSTILLPAGNFELNQTWSIPEGQVVTLSAGTTVQLAPGTSIYVRGVLNMPGTQDAPILLENAVAGQPWGCLIYHETKRNSRLDYVTIRYASMAKINQVNFTGGVSVYYATIMMNDCTFDRIQADDGINVKYSNSRLLRCQFLMARDDALDYDFSEGEIRDCYFYRPGGDGIDCGTATSMITGNWVQSPGDKCVSVGEHSAPVVEGNFLIGGEYGIAVKDDSHPIIQNNTICKNQKGISFYIKKPDEFDCPTGIIERCLIWDNVQSVENLCDAQFTLERSLVQGGFEGDKIMTDAPEFDPNASTQGLEYILKENSLYAKKGWGASRGNWQ